MLDFGPRKRGLTCCLTVSVGAQDVVVKFTAHAFSCQRTQFNVFCYFNANSGVMQCHAVLDVIYLLGVWVCLFVILYTVKLIFPISLLLSSHLLIKCAHSAFHSIFDVNNKQ